VAEAKSWGIPLSVRPALLEYLMHIAQIVADPSVVNEIANDGELESTLKRFSLRARREETRQLYAVAHDQRVEPQNRVSIKEYFGW